MIHEGGKMPSKVLRTNNIDKFIKSMQEEGFRQVKKEKQRDFWGNYSLKLKFQKDTEKVKMIATHDEDIKDIVILKSNNKDILETFF